MTLLFTMLPFYIAGNLHCIGMCGPLVMMIGKHRYRYYYFIGRTLSFTLAGLLAGGFGEVLNISLKAYHLDAFVSFFFGSLIFLASFFTLVKWPYPGLHLLQQKLKKTNQSLSLLMLKDEPLSSFLFGFFTLLLPCGQTLIVFSACALSGSLFEGFVNGFFFALLTTPSLWTAMHVHSLFLNLKKYYNKIVGSLGLLVGLLAFLRGFAELGIIPHWILEFAWLSPYHVVIY